jgi:transcriptional regulator with XRE-family HTH domain
MVMKIFGQRLKELRTEKGLSTMALGKIIGVSDMAISRWENSKTDIISENLIKLSKYFGVSTDYLLGIED